jgi:hypothetical protein
MRKRKPLVAIDERRKFDVINIFFIVPVPVDPAHRWFPCGSPAKNR